jgi:methanogenic corrinoid protein MtbC1
MISSQTYRGYLDSLVAGDRHHCGKVVQQLLDRRLPLRRLHLDLFQQSLYDVGELWAANRISVAAEHMATAITEGLLNQVAPGLPSGRRTGKTVLVAGIQPELHQVGGRMVADTFEAGGWRSLYAGSNIPPAELCRLIGEAKPSLVALSLTLYANLPALRAGIDAVRRESPGLPILVGGRGFLSGGADLVRGFSSVTCAPTLEQLDLFLQGGNHKGAARGFGDPNPTVGGSATRLRPRRKP